MYVSYRKQFGSSCEGPGRPLEANPTGKYQCLLTLRLLVVLIIFFDPSILERFLCFDLILLFLQDVDLSFFFI